MSATHFEATKLAALSERDTVVFIARRTDVRLLLRAASVDVFTVCCGAQLPLLASLCQRVAQSAARGFVVAFEAGRRALRCASPAAISTARRRRRRRRDACRQLCGLAAAAFSPAASQSARRRATRCVFMCVCFMCVEQSHAHVDESLLELSAKLVLNALSTISWVGADRRSPIADCARPALTTCAARQVRVGKVFGNRMIDLGISNNKLFFRAQCRSFVVCRRCCCRR